MPEIIKDRKSCQTCKTSSDKKLSKCAKCHAVSYCGQECQRKDWPRHSNFCFPVQISCIPRMRLGLVAARNFKKGERIFVDRVTISVSMTGHIDKQFVDALKEEMEKLSEEEKTLFYKLKETEMHDEDHQLCWVNNIGKEENCLEELKIFLGNQIDARIYLKLSLMNHSCSPNATEGQTINFDESKEIEVRAIKDIAKGEEITIFYFTSAIESLKKKDELRANIKKGFGFDCLCAVCYGQIPDQDDIKEKLLELKSGICRNNYYTKRILDWKMEARDVNEMVDLVQEFHIGRIELRNHIYVDLAKIAHMARDPVLRKKAFDMWETLVEETGLWHLKGHYEKVKGTLDNWSSEFESKKHPRKEEVDAIFGRGK